MKMRVSPCQGWIRAGLGGGFQRPHRGGADRDDAPALGLGAANLVASRCAHLNPFRVHTVFRNLLDSQRLKGPGPDVQGDEGLRHAQRRQLLQQA